ncbi:MAG: hypothetical protein U9Q03_05445 [Patescibacteria group bacterium]|nr:hypothetical protein [Patescibacteria group bacterium]
MWPSREDKGNNITIPYPMMIAIIISVISLMISIGVARWSSLLLEEQLELRKEFVDLNARQDQVGIQYEFWLEQLEENLEEAKGLKE